MFKLLTSPTEQKFHGTRRVTPEIPIMERTLFGSKHSGCSEVPIKH